MNLTLTRTTRTALSTIGDLRDESGNLLCNILEDFDRGLDYAHRLVAIMAVKVPGKTAIPTGRYRIVVTFSNRFQRELPQVLDVPGFAGIRIHPGNTDKDTEGCLLPGIAKGIDYVGSSRVEFDKLNSMIHRTIQSGEQIWLTIQ